MTDIPVWQSPGGEPLGGGTVDSPAPSPAHAGPYGPAGTPRTGAWAPPPKPGLIPLRPLDFGALFGATFQVLRRNPRSTFGVAVGLTALVTFASTGIVSIVTLLGADRITRAAPEDAEAIALGTGAIILLSALIAAALSVIAQALLQGVIVLEVASGVVGERLAFRELWARGKGRWGALIGWSLLLTAALAAAVAVLVVVIVLMVAFGDTAGLAAGILFGVVGGLGMLVLGAWLWIKLAFVPLAIVLERRTLPESVRRAWLLVRGRFWRTFGILVLISVIVQTAGSVVTAPFSLAAGFTGALVNPTGDLETGLGLLLGINLVAVAIGAVVGAVGAVLLAAAASLVYIDARMRDEGLDLDLQRFIEARAHGIPVADPYRPPLS